MGRKASGPALTVTMDEEKMWKEAYQAWKLGVPLRRLEKKYGKPKSTLHRKFKEIENQEEASEGSAEKAGSEAVNEQSGEVDTELEQKRSSIQQLRKSIERKRELMALEKEEKRLKIEHLEVSAQYDSSKISDYIEEVLAFEEESLVFQFWDCCSRLHFSHKDGADEAFEFTTYEDWGEERGGGDDATFRDYVKHHLQEWISEKRREEEFGESFHG